MENKPTPATRETDPAAAVEFLMWYLSRQDIRLTPEEWFDTLALGEIPDDRVLELSSPAVDQGLIFMDEEIPDRAPFQLPVLILLLMLAKLDGMHLSDQSFLALCYRFGAEDGQTHSLEETAQKFGFTRERIRMLENRILRRIRAKRAKKIRDFYS